MALFDKLDKHLQAAAAHWPDALTHGAESVACALVSFSAKETESLQYQFSETLTLTLSARVKAFTVAPVRGDIITYQEKQHRVLKTNLSQDQNEIRLYLGGVNG